MSETKKLAKNKNVVPGNITQEQAENIALHQEVDELRESLDRAMDALDKTTNMVQELVAKQEAEPEAQEPAPAVESMNVVYDPFESQDPHRFLSEPPGYKLGWLNPLYRDKHRSWRGWTPVQYDDPIGMELHKYLLEAPRRMENAMDSVVRRGDVVLCKLPIELWNQRRAKIQARNQRMPEGAKRVDSSDQEFTRKVVPEHGRQLLSADSPSP